MLAAAIYNSAEASDRQFSRAWRLASKSIPMVSRPHNVGAVRGIHCRKIKWLAGGSQVRGLIAQCGTERMDTSGLDQTQSNPKPTVSNKPATPRALRGSRLARL